LYAAIVRAQWTVSSLRGFIARTKREGEKPWLGERPIVLTSFCATHRAYPEIDTDVPGAPVIQAAYIDQIIAGGGTENDQGRVDSGERPKFLYLGMCLANECKPDDLQLANTRDYTAIAVSPGQQRAIDALAYLESDQFWLDVAHKNGVYNDARVRRAAAQNRSDLRMLTPEHEDELASLAHGMMFLYLPIIFGVFILYWCCRFVMWWAKRWRRRHPVFISGYISNG
jgi:hypothetical protein